MRTIAGCLTAIATVSLLTGCSTGRVGPDDNPSFAPIPGRWVKVPQAPLSARHGAAGAWADGRFVVVGGDSSPACPPAASCVEPADPPLSDGATFDPSSGRWQPIAPAPRPIDAQTNTVVAGGQLYLPSSGHSAAGGVVLLSYDPAKDAWSQRPLAPGGFSQLVPAGKTVAAIGRSDENAKARDAVLDLDTDRWTELPEDPLGPSFDRDGAWIGNRLLLTTKDLVPNPGAEKPAVTRLAVLDESLTRWTTQPDSAIIGGLPTPVAGRVVFPEIEYADGGKVGNWGRPYPFGGIFDPATGTWTALPTPPSGDTGLADALGTVGDRTLVGGHLLNPVTDAWTQLPTAPWRGERTGHSVLTSPGHILVWGGAAGRANVADGFLQP